MLLSNLFSSKTQKPIISIQQVRSLQLVQEIKQNDMCSYQEIIPISVNLHLIKSCNYKCKFCFATFNDIGHVQPYLALKDSIELLNMLKAAGTEKVNFVGGEPTIHPHIKQLLQHSKEIGFVVSIVTNGSYLDKVLDTHGQFIDWVGLSVDSAIESIQLELQRGNGDHVKNSLKLFQRLNSMQIKTKLNTVVTRLNWREDMSWFVEQADPIRWKVFQVLPVDGQNDGKVEDLLINRDQFNYFLDVHKNYNPIAENNDAMTSSYVMIDPLGRFFHNTFGFYQYSQPILEVGVKKAMEQVYWDQNKFLQRDGLYDWQ
eukprot:TRINITY_DN2840_c0_g2_i1.p2 TRINITY_DN2840_c0_g2~~TRINITY_DN2840_c0_g2_i1.p2  ORF type:complete len:358 (-),score=17.80 TRINITY_DN2840_c0_g2_i1:383-1327(-)